MSRGFIKEGDQEEVPVVPPRAHLPKGVPNYVTNEGLCALLSERQGLENQRAECGDNYIAANFINAKLNLLAERINSAVVVDLKKSDNTVVCFGAWVKYNNRTVRIVGVDEADLQQGLLSFVSPIAKALMGKRVGDVFEIVIPKGKEIINVQQISLEPLELTVLNHKSEGSNVDRKTLRNEEKTRQKSASESKNEIKTADYQDVVAGNEEFAGQNDVFEPEENIMEFLPLVNERGIIVGRALYADLHKGSKIIHPSVHLHLKNGDRVEKYWWHVAFGEMPETTLRRKLKENFEISDACPKLKKSYIRETKLEKELVYVFKMETETELLRTPQSKNYFEIFVKD